MTFFPLHYQLSCNKKIRTKGEILISATQGNIWNNSTGGPQRQIIRVLALKY